MASDDLINKQLGQYQIRSLLGRGGMAAVFLARQASMDRDVAIKVMTPELADDEQFVARFENEAQVIARLQHPHILPVIDFGREDKNIYIVMRLVRGGSLDDRLAEGPLPLRLASRMLIQIASALTFAHEQGIIHRDLKPNNVLLDERNNAYLTDFGIAKMLAGTAKLTATGNILGTPAYMAPEQWRGEPVDARTDIYSLGVMLYEMVLGRLPFEGDTPYTLMYKHFNDAPPPPRQMNPNIEPGIEAVILRALAKEPDDRFQSAEEVSEAFGDAIRGLPTGVGAPPMDAMDRTVIGDEAAPTASASPTPAVDEMPTMMPGGASPPTPLPATPPQASIPAPAAGETRAGAGAEPGAPARRGLNPLVIGGAIAAVIIIIAVIAVLAMGGDDGKKAAVVPTATETLTPTDVPTDTPEPTATNTPTDTPEPTATDTPQPTNTATPTNTPTYTATPRTTTATIAVERANVRSGPGFDYPVIGTLGRDEDALVNGISEDRGWYQIVFGPQLGWISAETVRISGNPNIASILWPTNTPVPSNTPTVTPSLTPTPQPTDTPTPTPMPTADPALFLPEQFDRITMGVFNLSLEYPSNWVSPSYLENLGYYSLVPGSQLEPGRYPWIRISRGTPDELVERGFTTNASSPGLAVENTTGMVNGAQRLVDGFRYPTTMMNTQLTSQNSWAWVIVVSDDDWVYIIAHVPMNGSDQEFGRSVLDPMVRSLEIDGVAITGEPTVEDEVDPAVFVPTTFASASLDNIDITLDYPTNWPTPSGLGVLYLLAPVDSNHPLTNVYPTIAIARGTPDELVSAGMTSVTTDAVSALEHPFGTDFTGMSQRVDTFAYPALKLDQRDGEIHAWAWLFEISDSDWLYIIATAASGDYDQAFGSDVLGQLLNTMAIDGQPLVPAGTPGGDENTNTLSTLPIQLGDPVLDRFDNNDNDWRFASIIEGQLLMDTPELDFLRWSFPFTLLEGSRAYYAQITGQLVSDTNYYQYGIAFRVVDSNNFYYFVIDHFQQYSLYSVTNGDLVTLIPATVSPLIEVGPNKPHTFGVLVIGDYIEVYLNNEIVGTVRDATHTVGSMRPASYTYVDSDSTVTTAYDDFATLPLTITGNPELDEQGVVAIASAGGNGADILAAADSTAERLISLSPNQQFVPLARTNDSAYLYGYGRGATGWVASRDVTLARGGKPLAVQALPILDATAPGIRVTVWPVVWPEEGTTAPTPSAPTSTAPPPASMLSYGQTVQDTIELGETTTWLFNGVSGDVVQIGTDTGTNTALDLAITLRDPAGDMVTFDDDSGPGLNPLIDGFALSASGLYTIEIETFRGDGDFSLTLEKTN